MNIIEPVNAIETRTRSYPTTPNIRAGWTFADEFIRETLVPSDSFPLYTTNVVGTGTGAIASGSVLQLDTSAGIGDLVNVRTGEMGISRNVNDTNIDSRTKAELNLIYFVSTSGRTDTECFLGWLETVASVTGIPTTARHLGLFYDLSVSPNLFLTSADGTTQTTTDTGIAVAGGVMRLNIVWTGDDDAIISLFAANSSTVLSSQTVTALSMTNRNFKVDAFIEAEAAAVKTVQVLEWKVAVS